MGLPAAPIDVVNMSLAYIGQDDTAASIETPTTRSEKVAARFYEQTRREILRMGNWNFAKKRADITRTGAGQNTDYGDVYALPNDFIRLLTVQGINEVSRETDYDIQGRSLLFNGSGAASINIRYISDETDVTIWDSLTLDVFALKLAMKMAYPLSKKEKLVAQLNELLKLALQDAYSIDGQERPPKRIENSVIINERRNLNSRNRDNRFHQFT